MRKTSITKKTALLAATGILAASMVPAAALATTVTSNDTATAGVWVDADCDGNGAPSASGEPSTDEDDVVSTTWSVTIPDQLALTAASGTEAGKPGTYEGTATISYKGEIGTAQTLTVSASELTLSDANGWSAAVKTTPINSGLSSLTYAQVYNLGSGGSGTSSVSVELPAGDWSGTETYTVTVAS